MKHTLKKLYYAIAHRRQLKQYSLDLGYIFHTERIYDNEIYDRLLEFCRTYHSLTGAHPICAIIPPTNALLKREMVEAQFSEEEFIDRIHQLSEYATIGYHGHFYLNQDPEYHNGIHCNSYNRADMETQALADMHWFKKNAVSHNDIYSAGWWFMNEDLMRHLIGQGFRYDFSFSKSPFFYNAYSAHMMDHHDIQTGEVFDFRVDDEKKMKCIQNFIGMHTTPFPQDFDRNMSKIIENGNDLVGVVNAHDYDLDLENTLKCIRYQLEVNDVRFKSFQYLSQVPAMKTVRLIGMTN